MDWSYLFTGLDALSVYHAVSTWTASEGRSGTLLFGGKRSSAEKWELGRPCRLLATGDCELSLKPCCKVIRTSRLLLWRVGRYLSHAKCYKLVENTGSYHLTFNEIRVTIVIFAYLTSSTRHWTLLSYYWELELFAVYFCRFGSYIAAASSPPHLVQFSRSKISWEGEWCTTAGKVM